MYQNNYFGDAGCILPKKLLSALDYALEKAY